MRVVMIAAVLAIAGCGTTPGRTNPPPPALIKVPVATYVPIDAALTKRCNWTRTGKPSAVFEVSNGRKRCLGQYEAQLDTIEQVQGKPVPTDNP